MVMTISDGLLLSLYWLLAQLVLWVVRFMPITNQIQAWYISIDGKLHVVGGGPIVHIAFENITEPVVCVWTYEVIEVDLSLRYFKRKVYVVETYQNFRYGDKPLGTVFSGDVAQHLIEQGH